MTLIRDKDHMPVRSTLIVWSEFLEQTGSTEDIVIELMDIGWLNPTRTAESAMLFRAKDVYRLRKLLRLRTDFELHTIGASIIVDLLDRIDELEKRIHALAHQGL